MKEEFLDKIIFYFENAPSGRRGKLDEPFINKIREFLNKLGPKKIWEKKGILNKDQNTNIFPDFVMILNNKIIACEAEKKAVTAKFDLYKNIKIFDELWFFTEIPLEKKHLHYKFENDIKKPQKFFGLNEVGKIVEIKPTKSAVSVT